MAAVLATLTALFAVMNGVAVAASAPPRPSQCYACLHGTPMLAKDSGRTYMSYASCPLQPVACLSHEGSCIYGKVHTQTSIGPIELMITGCYPEQYNDPIRCYKMDRDKDKQTGADLLQSNYCLCADRDNCNDQKLRDYAAQHDFVRFSAKALDNLRIADEADKQQQQQQDDSYKHHHTDAFTTVKPVPTAPHKYTTTQQYSPWRDAQYQADYEADQRRRRLEEERKQHQRLKHQQKVDRERINRSQAIQFENLATPPPATAVSRTDSARQPTAIGLTMTMLLLLWRGLL